MFLHEREIVLVNFDPTIGIEIKKVRPALILRKFSKKHLIVLPITSKEKADDISFTFTSLSFLREGKHYANISQVRTIDQSRCIRKLGKISSFLFSRVQKKRQKC